MRSVKLLLAIACCIPALPAASDQAVETRKVQAVTIERVLATPNSFQSSTIRFPAIWVGVTNIFDNQRSHFRPERYINVAVWDDRADLWEPAARAKPMVTLYMSKDQPGADRPARLQRYQAVEVEGYVSNVMDGQPWIEVTAIRPLEKRGAFTDAAIAQVERAVAFAKDGARDLAEEHFAAALTADLPVSARITISELRALSLMEATRFDEAATVIRGLLPLAEADPLQTQARSAGFHAALAFCLSEAAGTDAGKHTEAVAEAQKAVAIDPTLSRAYAVLGVSLAGLGRFDEARVQCDRAVRMRPEDAAVRLALGRILSQQGRFDDAIAALKHAIDLTPKDARVHRAIAAAYLGRGRQGEPSDLPIAYKECDITLRLAAKDAEAHVLAGQIIEVAVARTVELPLAGGKAVPTRAQAKERYETALAIDPTNAAAKAALQALSDAEKPAVDAKPTAAPVAAPAAAPAPEAVPTPAPAPEAAPAPAPEAAPAPAPEAAPAPAPAP